MPTSVGYSTSKLLRSHENLNDGMSCVLMTDNSPILKPISRCTCKKPIHSSKCMRKTTRFLCGRCEENCI